MRLLLTFLTMAISNAFYAQEPHENPDHVKGNSATIYQALPFYNEACEYYAKGDTARAKYALHEAINTSFALTEAHLFLADIYRQQGMTDSAFYFYNSGIDFAIEQKPNYYFKLFETGMLNGQYDFIKHNLKHFNKLYGKLGASEPYEEGYPYLRQHFEYYKDCIEMMYDFKSWERRYEVSEKLNAKKSSSALVFDEKVVSVKNGRVGIETKRRENWKRKPVKGMPDDVTYASLSAGGKHIVFTRQVEGKERIYIAKRSGSKVSDIASLPQEINNGNNNKTPYLRGNTLYFSSDRNGDFDLFLAVLSDDLKTVKKTEALNRVNSPGDDISPYIDETNKRFYFSSDGHLTFGGFDILECTDYETVNGIMIPINPRNPGASFNSYHDELQVSSAEENFLLFRSFRNGGQQIQLLEPAEVQEQIYFEITPKELNP